MEATQLSVSVNLWVFPGLVLVITTATDFITTGLQSHFSSTESQQHRQVTAVLGS